jgi:hypothetical protein
MGPHSGKKGRMNYHYADWVYRKYGLEDTLTDEYFYRVRKEFDSL